MTVYRLTFDVSMVLESSVDVDAKNIDEAIALAEDITAAFYNEPASDRAKKMTDRIALTFTPRDGWRGKDVNVSTVLPVQADGTVKQPEEDE